MLTLNQAIITLSNVSDPLHNKLMGLIKDKAKQILATKESPEARTMIELHNLLFNMGTLSEKQYRWMAGFAVNNKLEL